MEDNTYDQIYSIINHIENTLAVDQWVINHVHVWPYLRRNLFLELYNAGTPVKTKKAPLLFNKLKSAAALFNPFFWCQLFKKYDVILCSDGISRITIKEKSYDMFCSPLANELDKYQYKYLIISSINSLFKINDKKPPSFDCFETLATFLAKIVKPFIKKNEIVDYDQFLKLLDEHNIDASRFSKEKLMTNSFKIYLLSQIIYFLFKKINPRICFIVSYYSTFGYAFNIACRKLGVKSVDIQHGTQSNICDAYNRWNKVPPNGYAELPAIFWNWLKEDCEYINMWAKHTNGYHQAYLGGHPWISFWMNDNEITQHYDHLIGKLQNPIVDNESYTNILVTLQVGSVDHTEFWHQLLDIINSTSQKKIRWWIRKHPASLLHGNKEDHFIANIRNMNTNHVEASSYPLYSLLRHMDLHVTVESNAAMEAWLFGIKTIFLSNYARESFNNLFREGWGIILNKKEDLLSYLSDFKKIKHDKFTVTNKVTEINTFIKEYSKASFYKV